MNVCAVTVPIFLSRNPFPGHDVDEKETHKPCQGRTLSLLVVRKPMIDSEKDKRANRSSPVAGELDKVQPCYTGVRETL